jgi:DNA-binding CsgD family transcriptional regulator
MRPRPQSELRRADSVQRNDSVPSEELIQLLADLTSGKKEHVAASDTTLSEELLADVELNGFRYVLVRQPSAKAARVSLSPREHEIVRMVAQGHPNKVIAGVLNISGWTVCTHLRRIFAKLNVGTRAAMVARLLETGSIENASRRPSDSSKNCDPLARPKRTEPKLATKSHASAGHH